MSKIEALDETKRAESAPSLVDERYLTHLKKVNDIYYDQIRIADQKAAYIFTFMIAFLISSAEGKQVFNLEQYRSGELVAILLSALVAGAILVSLIAAILVVLPRHVRQTTSLYWAGWPTCRAAFIEAMAAGDERYLFDQYASNVDALAAISRAKYRLIWLAFRGLMVTVVGYVFLLIWKAGVAPA